MEIRLNTVLITIGLWLAIYTDEIMSDEITDLFPRVEGNLTRVTWAHAVNSRQLLNDALNSTVMMLEADIVLGTISGHPDEEPFPIMGHPPHTVSDLSLNDFLTEVLRFNSRQPTELTKKGVKLDFKSIEVFEISISILKSLYDQMSYPVWLNADILPGPIDSQVVPVNPQRFLAASTEFSRSCLSIGWTTRYGPTVHNGAYTEQQIESMLDAIQKNGVQQLITFPVRAGLAAKSLPLLQQLVQNVQNSTLTVWSSVGDPVNVENLRGLIFTIGLDRVYVDVPEKLLRELRLDEPPTK